MSNERARTPTSGAYEAHSANEAMARMEAMMTAMMVNVEQRFHQMEEAIQSQNRTPSESMPDHLRSEPETTNSAGPHVDQASENRDNSERSAASRPRAMLPNPAMFSGTVSDWPSWRILIENKLRVDGMCLGSPADQCAYIYSRLEKMALKNTSTFMRERREDGTPDDLLHYLERIYGDPNVKARAVQRLYALKQKPTQPFEKFLPSFERELADAGAL
jgi:exonuclease VII large subunit